MGGFHVSRIHMDGQFKVIQEKIIGQNIWINITSRDEHVPEIERYIRTVKERARCILNVLPFKKLPVRITAELIFNVIFWLNSFPSQNGILGTLSPRKIITGQEISYNAHCILEFGSYVQVHEEHSNNMGPRTTGAISLRPTGNSQGGHYFYSLTSGRRLNRNRWTLLPMPMEVIERVHQLAGKGLNSAEEIDFYDRDSDDTEDSSVDSCEVEQQAMNIDDNDSQSDVDVHVSEDHPDWSDEVPREEEASPIPEVHQLAQGFTSQSPIEEDEEVNPPTMAEAIDTQVINTDIDAQDLSAIDGIHRNSRYNLRPRRERDYSHLHVILESLVMTQYPMHKGIKVFGEAGTAAVLEELQQLHERGVIEPRDSDKLSQNEKASALEYLMFLKKKRCGKIKGRGCADGRKQREHTNKEDARSPTVAIESLVLSCIIDGMENRDVATVDIPGAFMQADMDEEVVHLKLHGKMAELLVQLAPSLYRKFVQIGKGKPTLYVQLRKALYGTLRAAYLFWKRLSDQLIKWHFVLNAYDPCVANKEINNSQCTIIWHVDDLKISHKESRVVDQIISLLEMEFGKESPHQDKGKKA